jgi:hippurate hydrolase
MLAVMMCIPAACWCSKNMQETKNEWKGTVKLIFQRVKKEHPVCASIMIREGVLENPSPELIVGMHVNPQLEKGKLSFRGGKVMASAMKIYITVKGKGGHAASPHQTTDIILGGIPYCSCPSAGM